MWVNGSLQLLLSAIYSEMKMRAVGHGFTRVGISPANKSNQNDLAFIKTTEPCNCSFQKSKTKIPNSGRCPRASFPLLAHKKKFEQS